jgi:hypothetical protein
MQSYKLWNDYSRHVPKAYRYTLGSKIDTSFLDTIELVFLASTMSKDKKIPFVERAVSKFDVLKFLLQVAWDIKTLDNKKYAIVSEQLSTIGKMLGGWHKSLL